MPAFRALLVVIFVVLVGYTAVVVTDHGPNLFAVFFGDMAAVNWAGQFNLDFMFMLLLSATWVAWRHDFSGGGLFLGALAFLGGSVFLAVYLLVLSVQAKGDVRKVLLGKQQRSPAGPA